MDLKPNMDEIIAEDPSVIDGIMEVSVEIGS